MEQEKGKIITVTGGDCMGKCTQVKLLSLLMDFFEIEHQVMSFPDYNTPIGALMGAMLDNVAVSVVGSRNTRTTWEVKKGGPSVQYQLLAIANMFEKAQYIRDLLDRGITVLCDRYDVDSLAYGLIDCDGNIGWIEQVQSLMPQSDCVVVLDGRYGYIRKGPKDENERSSLFQDTVRENYRTLASKYDHWGMVDCDQYSHLDKRESIFMVNKDIRQLISQYVPLFTFALNNDTMHVVHDMIDDILTREPKNKYLGV